MAHINGKRTKKKLNSQQIAASWLEQGILPVPLDKESKKPKSRKGWNTLRVEHDTIPQYFSKGDNVGGLWGEPSDWVVDIDLDWDEACEIAEYLLPPTLIYGRNKRPNSHYLYRCRGITGSKWTFGGKVPDHKNVVVEVRSTGSQSVLPPSIHPDGDRYVINEQEEITEIPRATLKRLMDEVAGGAVIIHYYPETGIQHDYVHAVTGALMHSGWSEERTRNFMGAVIEVTQKYDDETAQRKRTVNNTIEHFKKGNRIMGWASLTQWVDGHVIKNLREWLTPKKKYEVAPSKIALPNKPGLEFDPKLGDVPGLVGEISQWSKNQSFLLQPAFDLAAGLMATAVTSMNKYVIDGWHTPLQPYTMLLAPTSMGKGAALNAVYRFSKKMGLQDFVFQGFQSYYALLDQLVESPHMAAWLWDEAARHLAAARSPGSPDFATISHIISLYGRANDEVPGSPGRRNAVPPLTKPFLTILATAQPLQLIEAVSSADIATGLLNRLVLFDCGDTPPEPNLQRTDLFPSRMRRAAVDLKRHEPLRGDATAVKYDPATYAHYRDFDAYARSQVALGDENQIWGRANQNALMLAGVVAVGINPKRPMIDIRVAEWSTALITWSIQCWMARIGEYVGGSKREKQSKKVEQFIRRAKALQHRAGNGKTNSKHRERMRAGQMPRSVLMRLTRELNRRELDDIIDQLVEGNLIGMSDEDDYITYWPKH